MGLGHMCLDKRMTTMGLMPLADRGKRHSPVLRVWRHSGETVAVGKWHITLELQPTVTWSVTRCRIYDT